MKTKYLRRYLLCIDGFTDSGDGRLWSLQHPIKGTSVESYMVNLLDYDPMLKQDTDLINELERLAKVDEMWFCVYITCKISYESVKDDEGKPIEEFQMIKKMRIDKIEIENSKEPGQP